jgi:hypothetical protein
MSSAYQAWRKHRLDLLLSPPPIHVHRVSLNTVDASGAGTIPDDAEVVDSICAEVRSNGYARYQLEQVTGDARQIVARFYASLGLIEADSGVIAGNDHLSLLENSDNPTQRRFVPYSDRAMNWHTDGYYNAQSSSVKCFCLHCLQPASSGGELTLMDDQLLLIALYDHEPSVVPLLAHPQAMLLPATNDEFGHVRPDRLAPVFEVDSDGDLITRFTTRQRNIQWRSPETQQAMEVAIELLSQKQHWHTTLRLRSGEGVITRNILHRRTRFTDTEDEHGRQMLRGRYRHRPSAPMSEVSLAHNQE